MICERMMCYCGQKLILVSKVSESVTVLMIDDKTII